MRSNGAPKLEEGPSVREDQHSINAARTTASGCKFGGSTGPHGVPSTVAATEHGHSLTEDADSWATTQRARPCRRQRRQSRHPPPSAAVGLLALINHTVRRDWEGEVRPASTGRRHDRGADAAWRREETRRFASSFLGFELRGWRRQTSVPARFGERGTDAAPALSASVTDSLRPRPRWHRSRYATVELRGLSFRTDTDLPLYLAPAASGRWLRARERLASFTGCSRPIANPRRPRFRERESGDSGGTLGRNSHRLR